MIRKIISTLRFIYRTLKKIDIINKDTIQEYYLNNYKEYLLISKWLERIPYDKDSFFILKINNLYLLIDDKSSEFSSMSRGAFIFSHPLGSPFIIDSFETPIYDLKKSWEDIHPKDIIDKKNLDNQLEKKLNNIELISK